MKKKRQGWLCPAVLVFTAYMLFFLLAPVSALSAGDPASMGGSAHLPDYTERYGWEHSHDHEHPAPRPLGRGRRSIQNQIYLAVFVDFPDVTGWSMSDQQAVENAKNILNDGNGSVAYPGGRAPLISLKEYVARESYGRYQVTAQIYPQDNAGQVIAYTSKNPRSYYTPQSPTNPGGYTSANMADREKELIDEVLAAVAVQIEAQTTGQQLDADGDGSIDAISFFMQGVRGGNWGDLLWSHKASGSSPTTINGKGLNNYNLINVEGYDAPGQILSLNRSSYATIHHEFMHTLGLPDLYRADHSGNPVGIYDIMAKSIGYNPQPMLAYYPSAWGWRGPLPTISSSTTGSTTVTAPKYKDPAEQRAVEIRSPLNTKEYFVVEYYGKRDKVPSIMTSDASGIIVYRINTEQVNNGNFMGSINGLRDGIYIFRPGETALGAGNGDLTKATLNQSRRSLGKPMGSETAGVFDNGTLFYSDGSNSGIVLTVTSQTQDSVTFTVTMPDVAGNGTQADPFLIRNVGDFDLVNGSPNAYFRLAQDMDLSGTPFTGAIFGQLGNAFKGHFDGDGHTISNVTLTDGEGLWNSIEGGTVENLILSNITVSSSLVGGPTGSVAGVLTDGATLRNIVVESGSVSSLNVDSGTMGAGGLVGATYHSTIENSHTYASVLEGTYTGGLIGYQQNSTIRNCSASGAVSAGKTATGGLIGRSRKVSNAQHVTPQNVYFNQVTTGQREPVGSVENISMAEAKKGLTGLGYSPNFQLDLGGTDSLTLDHQASPATALALQASTENAAVARIDTGLRLVGVGAGTTKLHVDLPVGTHQMRMSSDVTVTGSAPAPTVTAVTVSPGSVTVAQGNTIQFTAIVEGTNNPSQNVTWSVSGGTSAGTSISASGLLTVAANETATLAVRATSTVDASKSDTATVTVTVAPPTVTSVTVTPANVAVTQGGTSQFAASVVGTNNPSQNVTWSFSGGTSMGTRITANGLLTVGANETATKLTVRATSRQDTTKSGTATVTVTAAPPTVTSVTVTPDNVTVTQGRTSQFTASVVGANSPSQNVTWSVSGGISAGTNISTSGLLAVASDETAMLTVTATSVADTSKSDTATITVTAAPPVLFTVTFRPGANGTMNPTAYSEEVAGGGMVTTVPGIVPNAGYTFLGWTVDGDTKQYSDADILSMAIQKNMTFTAAYKQGVTITGYVKTEANRMITASLKRGDAVITTAAAIQGKFVMADVEAGVYTLELSAPAALTRRMDLTVEAGINLEVATVDNPLTLIYGDANGDGIIDALDLGLIKTGFGKVKGDADYTEYIDINVDGIVDALDLGHVKTWFGSISKSYK